MPMACLTAHSRLCTTSMCDLVAPMFARPDTDPLGDNYIPCTCVELSVGSSIELAEKLREMLGFEMQWNGKPG